MPAMLLAMESKSIAPSTRSHHYSLKNIKPSTTLRHSSPLREEVYQSFDGFAQTTLPTSLPSLSATAQSSSTSTPSYLSNGNMSAAIDYFPSQAHNLGGYHHQAFPEHIYGLGDRPVYSDSNSFQNILTPHLPFSVSPALLTTKSPQTEPSRKRQISETDDSDTIQSIAKHQRRESIQQENSPFHPQYTMSPEISSVYSTPAIQPKTFSMAPMRHSPALSLSPSLLSNTTQYVPTTTFTQQYHSAPASTQPNGYPSPQSQSSLYQPSYSSTIARSGHQQGLGLTITPQLTSSSTVNGFITDQQQNGTSSSRPKPQCWDHGCNGRQFSTFSNLLRHQREKSGTAAKSYCPRCGAEFTRTTARNGHIAHAKCKARRHSAS